MSFRLKHTAIIAALSCAVQAYAMKPNDTIHNFTVRSVTEVPEVPGRLWRMTYAKNGADLVWLERDDDNKTFAIAFKTIPGDDTGVAHILEHSVLCGSKKYPVKEPFVDLLKSSLATFLNAMTYPDKTVYPVSSRNDADFLNLVDVYMDAVLHPLSVESRLALDQEGWHYEFDENGKLVMNGVVYSEMKGVFSNPDSVAFWETMRLLFPDCCYAHESGGDPNHIPELTFEAYKAFHAKFYHPSNSRIFLDGKVDIDATLAKLDSFLKDYERLDDIEVIPLQKPVAKTDTVKYEVSEADKDKYILVDGWVVGEFSDYEGRLAFGIISELLVGSNEAPLKKALLDKGLCEDVELASETVQQTAAMLVLRNTTKDKIEECRKTVRETLEKLVENGLDSKRIDAILNKCEFALREKDSGSYPRGIAFMSAAFEPWMYGGDPADAFSSRKLFDSLRAKISTGGFEKCLREMLVDNPHHAQLVLEPSVTLGEERAKALEAKLANVLAGWDEAKIAEVKAAAARLKEHQKSKDAPEDVAKLPVLSVKDIPVKGTQTESRTIEIDGRSVVLPKVGADGIFYLEMNFSLEDFTTEELLAVPFFVSLLGDIATKNYSTLELKSEIDANLGRFGISTLLATNEKTGKTTPYVSVLIAALEDKRADALRLAREVLLGTKFDDEKAAGDILKQERQMMELDVAGSGHRYAMRRASARLSARGEMSELFSGIAQLRWLQSAKADSALLARYAAFAKRIFAKNRITVCLTDNMPQEFAAEAVRAWPEGEPYAEGVRKSVLPSVDGAEGFIVPAEVAYAGAASLMPEGTAFSGSHAVGARILTLDYLWNEIRVLGGAYGMGLSVSTSGDVQYMTYRDPNPSRSLEKMAESGAALKRFCESGQDFGKYVVSAIGKTEPYRTPRKEMQHASSMHLSGRTQEDLDRERAEILGTKREDLLAFAEMLEECAKRQAVCVVGGKKPLSGCKIAKTENVSE